MYLPLSYQRTNPRTFTPNYVPGRDPVVDDPAPPITANQPIPVEGAPTYPTTLQADQQPTLAAAAPAPSTPTPAIDPSLLPSRSPVIMGVPVDTPKGIDPSLLPSASGVDTSTPRIPVEDAPPSHDPNTMAPMTASLPTGAMPVDVSGAGSAPLMVRKDKSGHPLLKGELGDGSQEDRLRAYGAAVNEYVPQKAKGWRRYLPILLNAGAMVAGSFGKNQNAVNQAGANLGRSIANPALADETWKANEQSEVKDQIDAIQEQQKSDLGIQKTRAEIARLGQTPKRVTQVVKAKDGTYRVIDKETGLGPDGKPVIGETQKSATGFTGWTHTPDGKAHYYSGGVDTGRVDPGRDKVLLPDGSLIDPSQKYTADTGAGKLTAAQERENQAATQENTTIQSMIDEKLAAEKDIWASRAQVSPTITKPDALGKPEEVENPAYKELTTRGNALHDEAVALKGRLKPIVPPTVSKSSSQYPSSEQKARDKWANSPEVKAKFKTVEEYLAEARKRKLIPPK